MTAAPAYRLSCRRPLRRPRLLLPGLVSLAGCPGGCQMPAAAPAAGRIVGV